MNHTSKLHKLFFLTVIVLISICSCEKVDHNPALASFDGGKVQQSEYVDHYLRSTKYKPDKFPTEENLKEIVLNKAMEKIAVTEAVQENIKDDSLYRDIVNKNEIRMLYSGYMQEEIVNTIVTDSVINKFYSEYTPQYRMSYILRPVVESSTKEFENTQRDTIYKVYDLLRAGQKFEDLAYKYSQDVRTNKKGGEVGFVIKEALGDAVLRAVLDTLPEFTYSVPFRGFGGYYIMYRGEKRDIPVPPFEKLRGRIWKTINHTRRHLIKQALDERFEKLTSKYNYQILEEVIEDIRISAGGDVAVSEYQSLKFDRLSESDMAKIIAKYDGGSVKLNELFKERKKRPTNMFEFRQRQLNIARQHLFAKNAKELNYQNQPELKAQLQDMRNSLLRTILYQRIVKDKAQSKADSVRSMPDNNQDASGLAKLRKKYEKELLEHFENELRIKYTFRFIEQNFNSTLNFAREKKELQNLEAAENQSETD